MSASIGDVPCLSVIIATHDNLPVLTRCLTSWRRFALNQPVELLVVEDGCTDGTVEALRVFEQQAWGAITFRVLHEQNVHELMCTNRGLREARAPLAMSWHDDMFLHAAWFVPELIATFDRYADIGLMSLSRGLRCLPWDGPLATFEDTIDWRRLQSTIGTGALNWVRLFEVDAVMRPWVVRQKCVERVGALDEAFRPTEWDEADFCYRIRAAGWKIATHGYERDGAYEHLLSSTLNRTPSATRQGVALRNARLFFDRWHDAIAREDTRPRRTWRRTMNVAGGWGTARAATQELARNLTGGRRV